MKTPVSFFRSKTYDASDFNSQGSIVLPILFGLVMLTTTLIEVNHARIDQNHSSLTMDRLADTQKMLASIIKLRASEGATFRESIDPSLDLAINAELRTCILGDSVGGTLCDSTKQNGLNLRLWDYQMSTPALTRISGTLGVDSVPTSIALYDIRGGLCVNAQEVSRECPLEVYTFFEATCQGGEAQCPTANSLRVHYTVRATRFQALDFQNPTTNEGPGSLASQNASNGSQGSSAAQTAVRLPDIEGWAPSVSINRILPSIIGSVTTNVSMELISTRSTTGGLYLSQIIEILKANVPGDINSPETIDWINQASLKLYEAGVTNKDIVAAFALQMDNARNFDLFGAIATTLAAAGITNSFSMQAMIVNNVINVEEAKTYDSVFTQAGVTDFKVANFMIANDITDVNLAKAYLQPITPEMISALGTYRPDLVESSALQAAYMAAYYYNGISDLRVLSAMGYGNVKDPVEVGQLYTIIQNLNVTDSKLIHAIYSGEVTDQTEVVRYLNDIKTLGIDNQDAQSSIIWNHYSSETAKAFWENLSPYLANTSVNILTVADLAPLDPAKMALYIQTLGAQNWLNNYNAIASLAAQFNSYDGTITSEVIAQFIQNYLNPPPDVNVAQTTSVDTSNTSTTEQTSQTSTSVTITPTSTTQMDLISATTATTYVF